MRTLALLLLPVLLAAVPPALAGEGAPRLILELSADGSVRLPGGDDPLDRAAIPEILAAEAAQRVKGLDVEIRAEREMKWPVVQRFIQELASPRVRIVKIRFDLPPREAPREIVLELRRVEGRTRASFEGSPFLDLDRYEKVLPRLLRAAREWDPEARVALGAGPLVAHRDVVRAIDLCLRAGLEDIRVFGVVRGLPAAGDLPPAEGLALSGPGSRVQLTTGARPSTAAALSKLPPFPSALVLARADAPWGEVAEAVEGCRAAGCDDVALALRGPRVREILALPVAFAPARGGEETALRLTLGGGAGAPVAWTVAQVGPGAFTPPPVSGTLDRHFRGLVGELRADRPGEVRVEVGIADDVPWREVARVLVAVRRTGFTEFRLVPR